MDPKFISDRREIKLERILSPNYIPLYSGRPKRDNDIGKDDILNLEIALGTSKTIEEFITQV